MAAGYGPASVLSSRWRFNPAFFVIISRIPEFRLQHDETQGLLRLAWVAGANPFNMRAGAEQLLELAHELEIRQLLLDMNTVPNIGVTDEAWLGLHWMPGLVQLPLERLVLVIDQSQIHNQLVVDALHDIVQPLIRFDSQYFPDPESALDWLTTETGTSARLPTLLAEWAATEAHPPARSARRAHRLL